MFRLCTRMLAFVIATAAAVALAAGNATGASSGMHTYGWGYGVVSHRTGGELLRPHGTPALDGVKDIGCGDYACYAVTPRGFVKSWGNNFEGLLGRGTADNRWHSRARLIPGLHGVEAVAGTSASGYALTTRGRVWSWGSNYYGQLGNGTHHARSRPGLVRGLSDVVSIATARGGGDMEDSVYAVTRTGHVWAWGDNEGGKLGDGTSRNRSHPVLVRSIAGIKEVAATSYAAYVLRRNGSVWRLDRHVHRLTTLSQVAQISACDERAYFLRSNGSVFQRDYVGGVKHVRGLPRITYIATTGYDEADRGGWTTGFGISTSRRLWAWGDGGAYGDGSSKNPPKPVLVAGLRHVARVFGGLSSNAYASVS